MAEKERIINKLMNYMIKNMGFKACDGYITKTLKNPREFLVSDHVVTTILNGNAYGGETKYIYSLIEDNYISDIEDKYTEFLNLTEKEGAFLDADDDGCYGFDVISEWIWDNVHVEADHSRVDIFVEKIAKRNGMQMSIAA